MQMMKPIAHIHTEFPEKFGIPRQSGLVPSLRGRIVMEEPFNSLDWVKGLEEYNYLWLIFDFSKAHRQEYPALVNPPRLGGKTKKGVFATRSPFRPNSMGLSSGKLESICVEEGKYELIVSGADLLDGTPIYDIKPYLPYTDCHTDALGSFGQEHSGDRLLVIIPDALKSQIKEEDLRKLEEVLALDPRAAFQKKEDFVYGMSFMNYDVRFQVVDEILEVMEVVDRTEDTYRHVK